MCLDVDSLIIPDMLAYCRIVRQYKPLPVLYNADQHCHTMQFVKLLLDLPF